MNIGAQLYTVREFLKTPEGIGETFLKIRAIGYRHVHCSGMGPIEPKRLHDLLEDNELTCVVTHMSPDRLLESTDAFIEDHRVIGCDSIGMSMMPERYRGSLEGLRQLIIDYRPIIRKIIDAGMTFHYHNHDLEFTRDGKRTYLDILLEEWPEANLLMCPFWVQVGGCDPIELIKRYGRRITHVHVKDMAFGGGSVGQGRIFTPVLEGNMNYKGIVDACRASKSVENLLVEQDDCYGADPFACLKVSYDNLMSLEP
ncbi:MAG: sugar phosphate isomerase/epimerase [Clostridia bacterium]|nr:sugar phosphate isomerase/epimerase [Clostridia bacterium]